MRYIFLIYASEASAMDISAQARGDKIAQHRAVIGEARGRGVLRGADPLKPTSAATTIRSRGGRTVITDGPFAETKEQLAGYYVIECRDLDDAIDWARKIPTSCQGECGAVEIRPVDDLEGA